MTKPAKPQTAGDGGNLPPLPGHEPPAASSAACQLGCGAQFCAPGCADAAGWHALLCTGQLAGGAHPLAEFARHAERTSESFLLAARALATALAAARAAGGTPAAVASAVATLQARCRLLHSAALHSSGKALTGGFICVCFGAQGFGQGVPWWEVSAAALAGPEPPPGDAAAAAAAEKKARRLRRAQREQLEESHQLLAVGLQHAHDLSSAQYGPLLDSTLFAELAGAVELCVVPVTHESPLTRYIRALVAAPRAEQSAAIEALLPVVDAASLRAGVALDEQGELGPSRAVRLDAAHGSAKRARMDAGAASFKLSETAAFRGDVDDGGYCGEQHTAPPVRDAASPPSASGVHWSDAPERVAASLAMLAPAIFSGVDGVALGLCCSALRHSCVPNCQFETAAGGALALVPLRDIAADEALTASFVATASPLDVRRAELRRRRIDCTCNRCSIDEAVAAGPLALDAALAALPQHALLTLARQAQEEGRHSDAEMLLSNLCQRHAADRVEPGEAAHALGVSQLALGRWSAAHATWAAAARASPLHAALAAQTAKDASYWPAPGAPCDDEAAGALLPLFGNGECFTRVPLGAGGATAVLTAAPLLDAAGCARLVAAAEAAAAGEGGWTTARHYAVPTTDLPLHRVPALLRWFNGAMQRSIAPLLAAAHPGAVDAARVRVHDAFVVRYDAAAQRHLPVHRDQSVFSLTIALNARTEFVGGGTFFAESCSVLCPDAGHLVAFSGETRHGGEPITAGVRYIIAAFLYLADDGS